MKAKHVFTTLAIAFTMGLSVAAGLSMGKETKQVKAVESNQIKVYFDGVSGWGTLGVHFGLDGNWQDCVATTGDEVSHGQWVTTFNASSATTLNCYFTQGDVYWHPDNSYSEATRDTDKSELSLGTVTLTGGHEYIVSYGSWQGQISGHKWFSYSVSQVEAGVTYTYSINGATPVEMVPDAGTQVKSSSAVSLAVDDVIVFRKNGVEMEIEPKEDTASTKVSLEGGQLKVVQAGTEILYLNYSTKTLWAGHYTIADGYYVYGSHNSWKYTKTAVAMNLEAGVYTSDVIAANANDIAKVVKVESNAITAYYNIYEGTVHTTTGAAATEDSGNVKFTAAGNYYIKISDLNEETPGSEYATYYVEDDDYVEPVYTFTIGGGEPYTLVKSGENTYRYQDFPVVGKQKIIVYRDGDVVTGQKGERTANNNCSEMCLTYVNNDHADLYFHTNDNTIWVSGLPDGGYHIVKNEKILVQMTHVDDYDGYTQWASESLTFAKDDTIEFIDTGIAESYAIVFSDAAIEEGALGSKFEIVAGVITCKEAVTTAVYLKLKNTGNKVYFGNVPQAVTDALEFANDFNDKIGAACHMDGSTDKVTLQTAWGLQATNYAALTDEAKLELAEGSASTVEEIRNFDAKYTKVYQLRGVAWELNNFLGKSFGSNNIRTVAIANNTALVVVLVSAITVIGAAGLFFVIRRKKHN